MAYSYTQPVTQAMKGGHTGPAPGGRVICVPVPTHSASKSKQVPDMRLHPSDLRKLQDLGFLPPPATGDARGGRVGGLNVKRVDQGKTSTWLFLGAAAQPTPAQLALAGNGCISPPLAHQMGRHQPQASGAAQQAMKKAPGLVCVKQTGLV